MTLNLQEQLIGIGAGSSIVMLALWALQIRTKDAGVVDVAWSALLGSAAVFAAMTGAGDVERRVLMSLMGGVWGLRLALHLLFDRVLKGPEDGRYLHMREQFGARVNFVFFWVFQAQAMLVVILCLPFLLASADGHRGLTFVDFAALALWLIGISGETIADRQLANFKKRTESSGRVCDVGLWRYSRHPNYFFEWLMWCAYALLAVPAQHGWIGIFSPALILLFVLKITGIPPTEARALKSRGDAYRAYQKSTSAFFPWFPKASQS